MEAGTLYINNKEIIDPTYGAISAQKVYVTNIFAFFTLNGQFDSNIVYAIDSNGNEIKVQDGDYYIHDIHLDNGLIVRKSMNALKALENDNTTEVELVIKYENGVITIAPKK